MPGRSISETNIAQMCEKQVLNTAMIRNARALLFPDTSRGALVVAAKRLDKRIARYPLRERADFGSVAVWAYAIREVRADPIRRSHRDLPFFGARMLGAVLTFV